MQSDMVEIADESSPEGRYSQQQPLLHPHAPTSSPTPSPHHMHSPASAHTPVMRQRQAPQQQQKEEEPDRVVRLVRSLRTLDVYPKTEEDIAIHTGSGGLISVVSLCLIALLVLSEVWSFLSVTTVHSIQVDTRPSPRLQINFDITFPALRCSETTLDIMDVSGEAVMAAGRRIHRHRIDGQGNPIGGRASAEYQDHAHDVDMANAPAKTPDTPPVSAAQAQMLAALGIAVPPAHGGAFGTPDAHEDQKGEGCRLEGSVRVNRVAGNIHVALGGAHAHPDAKADADADAADDAEDAEAAAIAKLGAAAPQHPSHPQHHQSPSSSSQHVHQFMLHEMASYNCSHIIHHLSFGQDYPGAVHPLDGTVQAIPEGVATTTAHMQYFIKVVPTHYESAFGQVVSTNQFSVTQQNHFISMQDAFRGGGGGGGSDGRIPGVFFVYDLSPFMVRVIEKRMAFSTFITSIFAIVGGIFTIAGVMDSVFHASAKIMRVASPMAKKH